MKQSSASNVAIALAILAGPLCYYGFMSGLAHFVHGTPREVIERHHAISALILGAGLLSLAASLWLSGFAFSGAKIRSLIASLTAAGLLFTAIFSSWP